MSNWLNKSGHISRNVHKHRKSLLNQSFRSIHDANPRHEEISEGGRMCESSWNRQPWLLAPELPNLPSWIFLSLLGLPRFLYHTISGHHQNLSLSTIAPFIIKMSPRRASQIPSVMNQSLMNEFLRIQLVSRRATRETQNLNRWHLRRVYGRFAGYFFVCWPRHTGKEFHSWASH